MEQLILPISISKLGLFEIGSYSKVQLVYNKLCNPDRPQTHEGSSCLRFPTVGITGLNWVLKEGQAREMAQWIKPCYPQISHKYQEGMAAI